MFMRDVFVGIIYPSCERSLFLGSSFWEVESCALRTGDTAAAEYILDTANYLLMEKLIINLGALGRNDRHFMLVLSVGSGSRMEILLLRRSAIPIKNTNRCKRLKDMAEKKCKNQQQCYW